MNHSITKNTHYYDNNINNNCNYYNETTTENNYYNNNNTQMNFSKTPPKKNTFQKLRNNSVNSSINNTQGNSDFSIGENGRNSSRQKNINQNDKIFFGKKKLNFEEVSNNRSYGEEFNVKFFHQIYKNL